MRTWIAAATMVVTAGWASGQSLKGPFSPYLELYDGDEWTLQVTVNIRAYQDVDAHTGMPVGDPFKFDTAAIVFPVLKRTASSVTDDRGLAGLIKLNDVDTNYKMQLASDYHSGARLAVWKLDESWAGQEVGLQVSVPSTCYKTKFNEQAASLVGWPKGDWPPDAASTFDPQFYVNMGPDGAYDMTPVRELVRRWTEGKDPKSIKPAPLAKFLAGQVMGWVQPTGSGLGSNRIGQLEGIDLQGAPLTAERRRGSDFDMVCLLAAVYREAGLPARTVIGYDIGESKDRDRGTFLERQKSANLRAWVEFALMDEGAGQLHWIPVDVARMRKSGSRTQPPDKEWKFFGTHDELNGVIPFAMHFHPPTTVRAYGSPGFWGWLVTPKPPESAVQALTFTAWRTPKHGGQDSKKGEAKRGG